MTNGRTQQWGASQLLVLGSIAVFFSACFLLGDFNPLVSWDHFKIILVAVFVPSLFCALLLFPAYWWMGKEKASQATDFALPFASSIFLISFSMLESLPVFSAIVASVEIPFKSLGNLLIEPGIAALTVTLLIYVKNLARMNSLISGNMARALLLLSVIVVPLIIFICWPTIGEAV